MTEALSLNLTALPATAAGPAASLASDGAMAGTGFDTLLSAQIFANGPSNPLNITVSSPSPVLPAAPSVPAVAASPVPVDTPAALLAPQPSPLLAPLSAPLIAPAATQVPAPAERAPAEVPVAGAGADAVAVAVAVAGKLPETGKPLPASLPRPAAAVADAVSDAVTAEPDDTSTPKAEASDEKGDKRPAAPVIAADPILPALTIVAIPVTVPQARPAQTPAASARVSAPARPVTRTAPGTATASQPAIGNAMSDHPAAPAPAIATPSIPTAAPTQAASTSIVPGITVAIAAAQPVLVPAAALPTTAPLPTVDRTEALPAGGRDYALSTRQPATMATSSPANGETSAAPGGQGEVGPGQPPMADPSLTSPAGPSPVVSPEATRGPATPLSAPIIPAAASLPAPVAVAPAAHDMTLLVDRLVEARAAARSAASPLTVTTAVRHAEFGSVSLRFDTAGDGLSVTMASTDPGFAPAAQAALASMPVPAAAASPDASAHSGQQNQPRHNLPEPAASPFQNGNGAAGGFAQQQQQQAQGQQYQPTFAAASRQPTRATSAESGAESADPSSNRSGVFA